MPGGGVREHRTGAGRFPPNPLGGRYGCGVPAGSRGPSAYWSSFARRSRSALTTTLTEETAIAAPANTGESSRPKAG